MSAPARLHIHQLVAARIVDWVAAAMFPHRVTVWDVAKAGRVSTLDVLLGFGGRRLALAPDGSICVASSWQGEGLVCYDVRTGFAVWRRPDLKMVRYVSFSTNGKYLFCGLENASSVVVETTWGGIDACWASVSDVTCSPHAPIHLRHGWENEIRTDRGELLARIGDERHQVADAAFGPDALCVAERNGSVYVVSLPDGDVRWREVAARGAQTLRVAAAPKTNEFVGVRRSTRSARLCELVRWNAETGTCREVVTFDATHAFTFCRDGGALVTGDGRLIDTNCGDVTQTLDFASSFDYRY